MQLQNNAIADILTSEQVVERITQNFLPPSWYPPTESKHCTKQNLLKQPNFVPNNYISKLKLAKCKNCSKTQTAVVIDNFVLSESVNFQLMIFFKMNESTLFSECFSLE